MAKVKLLSHSATELSLINNLKGSESIELTNRCSYNLGRSPNRNCRGEMSVEVFNKNAPESFCIKVKLVGIFLEEDNAQPDDVHKTTYRMLFPYARALVTSLTVAANVPPLFLPDINIDGQSIYVVENPKKS